MILYKITGKEELQASSLSSLLCSTNILSLTSKRHKNISSLCAKKKKRVTFNRLFWKEHILSGEKNITYVSIFDTAYVPAGKKCSVLRQIFLKKKKK